MFEGMYQVIEFAGTDRQQVVFATHSYAIANQFLNGHYPDEAERQQLGADILKDGSCEY
jgi:hypothetical protein